MKKIAIITGGSRGLGKNMAIALAKKNIDVILTYNSKKEEAENVVQEIEKLGAKAAAIQLNVAEVKTFDNFVESIKAILKNNFQTENFDILVNNAGIGIHKSFAETTEEEFDNLLNIQFKGPFFLTQKLLSVLN